jgi:hypothetical protein
LNNIAGFEIAEKSLNDKIARIVTEMKLK